MPYTSEQLRQMNLKKIDELLPRVQWAGRAWVTACLAEGLQFRITEAFRSQERQNALYAQGRWTPGKVVTWVKHSTHTDRMAVDVFAISGTYVDFEKVAKRFGIRRPTETVKVGDYGHFQFDQVGPEPKPVVPEPKTSITPEQRKKSLLRRIMDYVEPRRTRALEVLRRRFGP